MKYGLPDKPVETDLFVARGLSLEVRMYKYCNTELGIWEEPQAAAKRLVHFVVAWNLYRSIANHTDYRLQTLQYQTPALHDPIAHQQY